MEESDQNRDGSGDTEVKAFVSQTGNVGIAGVSSAGAADQTDPHQKTTVPSTPSASGEVDGENRTSSDAGVLSDSAGVIQTETTPVCVNVLEPKTCQPEAAIGEENVNNLPENKTSESLSKPNPPTPPQQQQQQNRETVVIYAGDTREDSVKSSSVNIHSNTSDLVTSEQNIEAMPMDSVPEDNNSMSNMSGLVSSEQNVEAMPKDSVPEDYSTVSRPVGQLSQEIIPSDTKTTNVTDTADMTSNKETKEDSEITPSSAVIDTNSQNNLLFKDSIKPQLPDANVSSIANISTIEAEKDCAKNFDDIDSNNEDIGSEVKKRRIETDKDEFENLKIPPVTDNQSEEEMEIETNMSEENKSVNTPTAPEQSSFTAFKSEENINVNTPTAPEQSSFTAFKSEENINVNTPTVPEQSSFTAFKSEENRNVNTPTVPEQSSFTPFSEESCDVTTSGESTTGGLINKSISARITYESSNARFGDESNDERIGEESSKVIIKTGKDITGNRIDDDSCDARLGFETNDAKYEEDSNLSSENIKPTRIGEVAFQGFPAEESNLSRLGDESNDARIGEETFVEFNAEESNMSRLGEESNDARIGEESLDARIGGETIDALIDEETNMSRIEEDSNVASVAEENNEASITATTTISAYDAYQSHGAFPAANLFEYQWPQETGAEWYMLQEQISEYLSVKSFKRKYRDLQRRAVDMNEKTFLHDRGVVSETQCDLGLTALKSEEVLDLMIKDYPMPYREYAEVLQEKERQTISEKNKKYNVPKFEKSKLADYMKKAVKSAAEFNVQFQRERREERKAYFDLQTMAIHYPTYKHKVLPPECTKVGSYPVALIPGQFQDYYKHYTSQELKYFPVGTAVYGPPKKFKDILIPETTEETSDDSEEDSAEDGSDSNSDDGESSDAESMGVAPLPAPLPGNDPAPDTPTANNKQKTTEAEAEIQEEPKKDKKEEKEVEKICRICKAGDDLLKGKVEDLVQCSECKTSGHPICLELTTQMIPVIRTYPWQCMECKTCVECMDPYDEDKMMFCDRCDRGYHTFCVGVKSIPTGRWECPSCKDMPSKPKKSRRQTRQNGVPSPKPTITS